MNKVCFWTALFDNVLCQGLMINELPQNVSNTSLKAVVMHLNFLYIYIQHLV